MATINKLTKTFIQKRVPGEFIQVPVEFVGDAQNASANVDGDTVLEDWWSGGGGAVSITTEQCLAQGGVPIGGYCTVTESVSVAGLVVNRIIRYPVVD